MTKTIKDHLSEFSKNIKVSFKNLDLLREALTHRSYLNELNGEQAELQHNERLEFLGDAVLELITTEYLFEQYPQRPEGDLTSFRAALVRTESLAHEAKKLNYGKYVFMSRGEEATGGRERPYILANTFEAVLGAIYLDQGIATASKFVTRILLPKINEIVEKRLDIDAKSKLQEISQEQLRVTPTYTLVDEVGPDHDKIFTMAVVIDSVEFGQGKGKSKQEAEQNAAENALKNWSTLLKQNTQLKN
jgi:ribonuclease-3